MKEDEKKILLGNIAKLEDRLSELNDELLGNKKEVKVVTLSAKDYFDITNEEDPESYDMFSIEGFGYDTMNLDNTAKQAKEDLIKKAQELRADVVVDLKYTAAGAGSSYGKVGSVIAYGTALKKDKK